MPCLTMSRRPFPLQHLGPHRCGGSKILQGPRLKCDTQYKVWMFTLK